VSRKQQQLCAGTSISAQKLAQLDTSTKSHATAQRIAIVNAAVDQPRGEAPADEAIFIRKQARL
tara:strand:+ start:627 stop:818 length:192 start_codon:yes stop_codon:yes gene_type:complete